MRRLGALPVSSGRLVFSTWVLEHTARGTWKKCRCPRYAGRIFYEVEVGGCAPSLSSLLFTMSFLGSLPLPHSLSGTSLGHFSSSFLFHWFLSSSLQLSPLLSSPLFLSSVVFFTSSSSFLSLRRHVRCTTLYFLHCFREHKEWRVLSGKYILIIPGLTRSFPDKVIVMPFLPRS